MVRKVIFLSVFLSGCTVSLGVEKSKTVDVEARQEIANIKNVIQSMASMIDKTIDEKITEKYKK